MRQASKFTRKWRSASPFRYSGLAQSPLAQLKAAQLLLLPLRLLRRRPRRQRQRRQRLVWPCAAGSIERAKGRRKGRTIYKRSAKNTHTNSFLRVHMLRTCACLPVCAGESKQPVTLDMRLYFLKSIHFFFHYSCKPIIGAK